MTEFKKIGHRWTMHNGTCVEYGHAGYKVVGQEEIVDDAIVEDDMKRQKDPSHWNSGGGLPDNADSWTVIDHLKFIGTRMTVLNKRMEELAKANKDIARSLSATPSGPGVRR